MKDFPLSRTGQTISLSMIDELMAAANRGVTITLVLVSGHQFYGTVKQRNSHILILSQSESGGRLQSWTIDVRQIAAFAVRE